MSLPCIAILLFSIFTIHSNQCSRFFEYNCQYVLNRAYQSHRETFIPDTSGSFDLFNSFY